MYHIKTISFIKDESKEANIFIANVLYGEGEETYREFGTFNMDTNTLSFVYGSTNCPQYVNITVKLSEQGDKTFNKYSYVLHLILSDDNIYLYK